MNRTRLGVIAVVVFAVLGWSAGAVGSEGPRVNVFDDCDAATFNSGPPTGPGLGHICDGNGKTTFQDFVAQLQANGVVDNKSAKGWKFAPGMIDLDAGQPFIAVNKGGETHSFTEVANFGGGCVAILNTLLGGLAPVPECATPAFPATLIPAGGTLDVAGLSPGVHRFECLIHPWMRTTVVVN